MLRDARQPRMCSLGTMYPESLSREDLAARTGASPASQLWQEAGRAGKIPHSSASTEGCGSRTPSVAAPAPG
jgi:hypothetical protein